jgi:hypothetical protein
MGEKTYQASSPSGQVIKDVDDQTATEIADILVKIPPTV